MRDESQKLALNAIMMKLSPVSATQFITGNTQDFERFFPAEDFIQIIMQKQKTRLLYIDH